MFLLLLFLQRFYYNYVDNNNVFNVYLHNHWTNLIGFCSAFVACNENVDNNSSWIFDVHNVWGIQVFV